MIAYVGEAAISPVDITYLSHFVANYLQLVTWTNTVVEEQE